MSMENMYMDRLEFRHFAFVKPLVPIEDQKLIELRRLYIAVDSLLKDVRIEGQKLQNYISTLHKEEELDVDAFILNEIANFIPIFDRISAGSMVASKNNCKVDASEKKTIIPTKGELAIVNFKKLKETVVNYPTLYGDLINIEKKIGITNSEEITLIPNEKYDKLKVHSIIKLLSSHIYRSDILVDSVKMLKIIMLINRIEELSKLLNVPKYKVSNASLIVSEALTSEQLDMQIQLYNDVIRINEYTKMLS